MERAVNPETGEVVFLVNNQWVKPTDTAKNEAGDTAFLVGNQWQIVKSAAPTPKASTPPPAMDALGNVIGEGAEEKFGNQKAASFDLIKDLAKQFAAPIAAAPFQLPKGAELAVKGLARQSMEGNPESLMPASVYQPGLDTEESLFGKETPQQAAQRKLQAQRAVAEVPSIPYAEQLSGFGQKVQRSIQNSLSEESKQALKNSAITGNILKGEVDFGKDPTVRGYALQIANVLGSTAPSLLTSIVTKSPALGGAVGGTMAADEAGQNAAQYINKMSDVELLQQSPFFSEMVAGGASSKEARALTIQKAAESGAALQGMAATFGDALTGKLVTGAFDDIIRKVTGGTKVGRAAGTGTLAGLEESMQETGEGIGSDIGIKSVIKSKEIGEDSAANAVLGFLGGAGPGGVRGLMVQDEQPAATPSAEQMMRERGFLVPEQQARPPVTPPSPAAERIEPAFEPEVKSIPEPTDLAKERIEEQRRVLELEKELESPEAAPIVTPEVAPIVTPEVAPEVAPALEAVTPEAPEATQDANQNLIERIGLPEGQALPNAANEKIEIDDALLLRDMMVKIVDDGLASGKTRQQISQQLENLTKGGIRPSDFNRIHDYMTERGVAETPAVIAETKPTAPEEVGSPLKQRYDKLAARKNGMQAAMRDGVLTNEEYTKFNQQLEQARAAYKAATEKAGEAEQNGMVPAGQNAGEPAQGKGIEPVTVRAEEDYANKSFEELQTLRDNADQTNNALDLAAVRKHFGPEVAASYENMNRRQRNKWWDENATDALDRDASTFNGVNEELLDEYIKAHNNFDTEAPRALGRSVGLLARKINDPGFKGSPDFVALKNALAYAKQQGWSEKEVLGGMRERAIEWAGADAQELFKDLFKTRPATVKKAQAAPVPAPAKAIPFTREDLTNEPMPERAEVQELLDQQAEATKAAEELSKRTAGTSLIKVLQGSLKDSEMSELGGRSRQIGKNPFISLVAKKGQPGSSMEDMVESGALNLFLPERMRPGHEDYVNSESAEYIRDKLRQNQYYTYQTQMEIDRVTNGIWDLEKLINEELSIDDINKEIQLAFDEQREADLAAEATPAKGAAGAAEQRKAEPTNDELDKREAQLEREAQLNQREARLLEERKRLEEERLKLENPTKEDVAEQEERKAKADELDQREQVRKESEAGAGQFELTREEGRQDTTGNLFEQPKPETVEVSPEQERNEALANFKTTLAITIPPFRAVGATKTQLLKPAPLSKPLVQEVMQIASDALDLGLPPAVLGNVKAAGSTRMDAAAIMSKSGWLMIAKKWKTESKASRLQIFIHELGHGVDFENGDIADTAQWGKAHVELENWYNNSPNKFLHPLAYPFAPHHRTKVRLPKESFAQAFSFYFTSPVDLQKNAPEAYSQIQSIVERINNESQRARAAGTTATSAAGIKIQPSRTAASTAVQPSAGAVSTPVGGAEQLENRSSEPVKTEEVNPSAGRTIFSQRPLVNWTAPEMSRRDNFLKYWQNRHIDTKRIIDEITKSVGAIDDRWNPYLMEEMFHGRAAKQTKDFMVNELRPLLQEMDRLDVTIPELEEYLHNKHAEERNVQVAKVNPTLPDEGSGITTAAARAYLANLSNDQKAKFDQVDKMVKVITGNTRQMLVDSGLESQETIDAWENTYGDYVPLSRDDVDYSSQQGKSVGQGFSVRGAASKRAIGSTRNVVDILANIALQRESTIVRAEKNRVATALYGLALKSPNPKFWLAVNPDSKKDMQATINELVNMGLTVQDAQNLMKEPTQTIIDTQTGLVTERVNPILRGANNVMSIRVNGKDRFVFFNQNNERAARMVAALKNLDADQLGFILGNLAKVTRYFASVNTQYNPVFGFYNFLRDSGGGAIQLSNTPLAGKQKEVASYVLPALRGIYLQLRADREGKVSSHPMAKLWEQFQQEGGQTGFRDQFSRADDRTKALEQELKKMSQGRANKFKEFLLGWLSDYNETMENAVRLAAYKVALDNGITKPRSGSLAKNLTVNFNRKGDVAVQAGALFAFFNSSIQGTATMAATLAGPAGKLIIGGGLFAGAMQAVLLSMYGFGDDDPPDFVKDKSFIFPRSDGTYGAFPMPLGYNVIPSTARIITEGVLAAKEGRKVDAAKRIEHLLGMYMDAFNPIGNAGWSMQTITPTAFDWLAALRENKDWTGKPIAREDFNKLNPTPGFKRAKEAASSFSMAISKFLNYASGGTEDTAGIVSPTPDQLDYLIGQAFGGLGREALKLSTTAKAWQTGEELPPHKIPLVGRFYGDTKGSSSVANHFYDNLKKMNEYENTIKGMATRQENVAKFLADNPEAALYKVADQVERNVQKLRKLRHTQVENSAPKEVVQSTEKLITNQMMILNEQIAKLEGRQEKK